MARVIALSNLKGGSAKSTTTIALGAELAKLGQCTLLVDVDAQGHVSEGYGIPALSLEHDLSEVLAGDVPLTDILIPLRENLTLAPGNLKLAYVEPYLINEVGRERKLADALQPVLSDYDIILIDCPPSVGIYTVNALRAATEVLVPITAEFFALIGVSMLFDSLERIKNGLKHTVGVTGIIPTRVTRTNNSRQVVDQIHTEIGSRYHIFTEIPEAVAVRSAAVAGKPVTEFDPTSKASEAYRIVAKELLNGRA